MNGNGHGGGYSGYDGGGFAPPPLTAIDRFLRGRTQIDHHAQNHEINQPFISWHGLCDFSVYSNMINNESQIACSSPFLSMPRSFSVDDHGDVFTNNIGECLTMEEVRNYLSRDRNQASNRLNEPEKISGSVKKSRGGVGKGATSKVFIKGQWSDEEDSKLIDLVNEYGEGKWAVIAEKMTGRAGKQCRERWRNHLRPDIKKDTWSEEEVKMLINAHRKIGNKWTEIAKLIPGRTENSIKNQWNATRRKQNSQRKNNRKEAKYKKPQSILLQDYIRSKCSDHNLSTSSTITTATTTSGAITGNSTTAFPELTNAYNNDSDPSLDITQSYGDEMSFMQAFFETTTSAASNKSLGNVIEPKPQAISHPLGFLGNSRCGVSSLSSTLHDENSNMYFNNYLEDDMSNMQLDF